MNQKHCWFLFHRVERREVSGLTLDAAVGTICSEKSSSHADWFAWQAGMASWLPVMQVREFSEKLASQDAQKGKKEVEDTAVIPPPYPGLKVDLGNGAERRKHHRFDLRLRSIILDEGSAFRTFTNNVSLGGLLLEDRVPLSNRGPTRILLQSPDGSENIAVEARWIEDSRGRLRLSFETLKDDQISQLETWFKTQASQQKIA